VLYGPRRYLDGQARPAVWLGCVGRSGRDNWRFDRCRWVMIVRFPGVGAPGRRDHLVMRQLDGAGIEGPLAPYGAGFARWLFSQGNTKSSVDHQSGLMGWLSRWLARKNLDADVISEAVVRRFHAGQSAGRGWATEGGAGTVAGGSSRTRRSRAAGAEHRPGAEAGSRLGLCKGAAQEARC